jgi:hypothetical protein
MVVLPSEFVMTRYPGYFWNIVEKKLYSIKVTGELRPMTFDKGGRFYGRDIAPGYRISVNGQKHKLTMEYLGKLKPVNDYETIGVTK